MTRRHDRPSAGLPEWSLMRTTTPPPVWAARRVPPAVLPAPAPWGIVHRPTRRWLAFGPEARCRSIVARLTGAAVAERPVPRPRPPTGR